MISDTMDGKSGVTLDPELQRRLEIARASEDKKQRLREQVKRERRFLIPLLAFVALLFPNLGRAKVLGHSMEPQFVEGDSLVILKTFRLFAPLKPGDMVVLHKQGGRYSGEELVKRVAFIQNADGNAAFPETVATSQGAVPFKTLFPYYTAGIKHVPANGYLVVGDNLMVSADSRDPDIGVIYDTEIQGKVLNPNRMSTDKVKFIDIQD